MTVQQEACAQIKNMSDEGAEFINQITACRITTGSAGGMSRPLRGIFQFRL